MSNLIGPIKNFFLAFFTKILAKIKKKFAFILLSNLIFSVGLLNIETIKRKQNIFILFKKLGFDWTYIIKF